MARDICQWLDQWPRQSLGRNTFAQHFRIQDRYCVWWIGPASSRNPNRGKILPGMCLVWILRRALGQVSPKRVCIQCQDKRVFATLASLCRQRACEVVDEYGRTIDTQRHSYAGRIAWLLVSFGMAATLPIWLLFRAVAARLSIGRKQTAASDKTTPAIVLNSEFPRHVNLSGDQGKPVVWYWQAFHDYVAREGSEIRVKYLLFTRRWRWSRPIHTGWSGLRNVEHMAPLEQSHLCWTDYVRQLPGHLLSVLRYWRLERQQSFQDSFVFQDADVSPLFVVPLRVAIAKMLKWSLSVRAIEKSLADLGNVRVVLVHDEFLPNGMRTIAAARNLGIPTVGIQHGLISNALIMPPGHHQSGLSPDYFSVYGEYVSEAIEEYGNYPRQRTWVNGSPRFDALANSSASPQVLRDHFNLPRDGFIILFTTARFEWSQSAFEMLMRVAKPLSDVHVCLKIHQRDEREVERYREIIRRSGNARAHIFTTHFEELLIACDAVLNNTCSTTLLEAMLCNRPSLYMEVFEEPIIYPMRYPFSERGGAVPIKTDDDLARAIGVLRQNRRTGMHSYSAPYLRRHVGPAANGQSCQSLFKQVCETFFQSDPTTWQRNLHEEGA